LPAVGRTEIPTLINWILDTIQRRLMQNVPNSFYKFSKWPFSFLFSLPVIPVLSCLVWCCCLMFCVLCCFILLRCLVFTLCCVSSVVLCCLIYLVFSFLIIQLSDVPPPFQLRKKETKPKAKTKKPRPRFILYVLYYILWSGDIVFNFYFYFHPYCRRQALNKKKEPHCSLY
jgi:hypothetical protein